MTIHNERKEELTKIASQEHIIQEIQAQPRNRHPHHIMAQGRIALGFEPTIDINSLPIPDQEELLFVMRSLRDTMFDLVQESSENRLWQA